MLNINTYHYKLDLTLTDDSVVALERALSAYLNYKYIILVESVESAFDLALCNAQKGSSVLCSPNAPFSLFQSIKQNELTTQYCDLKLDGTMETRFFKKSKTDKSSVLVLSHNHGILSDTEATLEFTQENELSFVEDATQALSQRTKSGAELVVYALDTLIPSSLTKGAFIATDDVTLAKSLQTKAKGGHVYNKLWNYDLLTEDVDHTLSLLVAQLALDALQKAQEREERIAAIQKLYYDKLTGNRLIELPSPSRLTPYPLFQIALIPVLFCPKEDIYQTLLDAGIDVKVGNKPIYKTTLYKDESLSLFGAEEVFKAQLLLPCHHIMRDEDVMFVVETVEKALETYAYRGCSF